MVQTVGVHLVAIEEGVDVMPEARIRADCSKIVAVGSALSWIPDRA